MLSRYLRRATMESLGACLPGCIHKHPSFLAHALCITGTWDADCDRAHAYNIQPASGAASCRAGILRRDGLTGLLFSVGCAAGMPTLSAASPAMT